MSDLRIKRWPIIRHVRWLILTIRFERWWSVAGQLFIAPNPSDLEYLRAVWEGRE